MKGTTPLNARPSDILDKSLQDGSIRRLAPFVGTMGKNLDSYCKYHRTDGHNKRLLDPQAANRTTDLERSTEEIQKEGETSDDKRRKGGTSRRQDTTREKEQEGTRGEIEHETADKGGINFIAGGFSDGGATPSARKRYAKAIMAIGSSEDNIVQESRVLIDGGSSANVIYGECFDKLKLPPSILKDYHGTLVGFSRELVAVRGHLSLHTTFGEKEDAKTVVAVHGRPGSVLLQHDHGKIASERSPVSSLLPALVREVSRPLPNGKVGLVKGDQAMARRCYAESVKVKTVQRGREDPGGSGNGKGSQKKKQVAGNTPKASG